ncbi:acyl-CoA desaturase, partial [Glutamicibacter soli]|nr:acyl-CoA desaturase [Glutamicibacter soli]
MPRSSLLVSPAPTVKPGDPQSFFHVKKLVGEAGLIRRRPGHYLGIGIVLAALLAGTVAGMLLLGESWIQLLMAAALGLLLTQFAFLAHEAAHRQILASGKTNDKLGRFLANFVVGISYQW